MTNPPPPWDKYLMKVDAVVDIEVNGGYVNFNMVEILANMYIGWAKSYGVETQVRDTFYYPKCGTVRRMVLRIPGAYEFTRSESGVHLSSQGVCDVHVYPHMEHEWFPKVLEDVEISAYRPGGAGGQQVGTAKFGVRVIHKPTGIVDTASDGMSQYKNKEEALNRLCGRLYESMRMEAEGRPFWPRRRYRPAEVIDLDTNEVHTDVSAIMAGDIDRFLTGTVNRKACPACGRDE